MRGLSKEKFRKYRYDSLFYKKTRMNHLVKIFLCAGILLAARGLMEAKTLSFSGLEWTVRANGYGAPGKNYWRGDNVWVDESGRLHLKIRKIGGRWTCAELWTNEKFLYGRYSFKVIGRIDRLDKNVVFGLFNFPSEAAKEGRGEIDVEFARWGNALNGGGNYTVWSDKTPGAFNTKNFSFELFGDYTSHGYTRTPQSVFFQSFHGHDETNEIYRWTHAGADVSKTPMPIYLNFWLYRGMPPGDGREAEIIISEVKYSPSKAGAKDK